MLGIYGDKRRRKKERPPRKKAMVPVRQGERPITADFLRSANCDDVRAVAQYVWSPELYCQLFAESDQAGRRRLRQAVLAGTIGRCRQQGFDPGVMLVEQEPVRSVNCKIACFRFGRLSCRARRRARAPRWCGWRRATRWTARDTCESRATSG